MSETINEDKLQYQYYYQNMECLCLLLVCPGDQHGFWLFPGEFFEGTSSS